MILVDYSQFGIATAMQFREDLKKGCAKEDVVHIIRHALLAGILHIKKEYGRQFGEIVLACDGRKYWRRDIFPHYKADRKKKRDSDPIDWKVLNDSITQIREEIDEFFPYKVIHVDEAEGDDVIAILTMYAAQNPAPMGLLDEPEPVLILSSDHDFMQLQKYHNVRQYSSIQKKWVVCDDPARKMNEHIAKAGDDGIPNVLSPSDVLVTDGIRQTPMRKARLEEFAVGGREACVDDAQRERWDLNRRLINFECIPPHVVGSIIDKFLNRPAKDNKKVFRYLCEKRCRLLLERVNEF